MYWASACKEKVVLQLKVSACAKQMKSTIVLISQRLTTMQQSPHVVVDVLAMAESQMSLLTMHALHAWRLVQCKWHVYSFTNTIV